MSYHDHYNAGRFRRYVVIFNIIRHISRFNGVLHIMRTTKTGVICGNEYRDKVPGILIVNKNLPLIELAIILIIIGIIIGTVIKKKNIIRGAEQKKVYTKFFSEWRIADLYFYAFQTVLFSTAPSKKPI